MHSFQNFIVRLIPNNPPPLETTIWKLVLRALHFAVLKAGYNVTGNARSKYCHILSEDEIYTKSLTRQPNCAPSWRLKHLNSIGIYLKLCLFKQTTFALHADCVSQSLRPQIRVKVEKVLDNTSRFPE